MINVILTILFGRNPRRSLGCSLIALVVIGVVVGGIFTVAAIQLKQDQDKALATYGDVVLNLCNNLSQNAAVDASLAKSASAKLAFIDAGNKTLRDAYNSALSADRLAKDKTDITGVVCVNETSTAINTDNYKDSAGVIKYTCTQYQKVMEAYLIDTKSSKLVAYQQFTGSAPPECPDKTSSNTSETGSSPAASEVTAWAIAGGAQ